MSAILVFGSHGRWTNLSPRSWNGKTTPAHPWVFWCRPTLSGDVRSRNSWLPVPALVLWNSRSDKCLVFLQATELANADSNDSIASMPRLAFIRCDMMRHTCYIVLLVLWNGGAHGFPLPRVGSVCSIGFNGPGAEDSQSIFRLWLQQKLLRGHADMCRIQDYVLEPKKKRSGSNNEAQGNRNVWSILLFRIQFWDVAPFIIIYPFIGISHDFPL